MRFFKIERGNVRGVIKYTRAFEHITGKLYRGIKKLVNYKLKINIFKIKSKAKKKIP